MQLSCLIVRVHPGYELHIPGNQQTDRRHSDDSKWKIMSNLMKHWTVCHIDYCNVPVGTKQHENYVEPNETMDGVSDYCNVLEGTKQHENPRWLQAFAYIFVRLVNI